MLRLEKINGHNVWDILKLKVAENQRHFVASNDKSIIEAYTTITGNGYAFPFGIYEDNTPVGFLMIGFDTDDYWDDAPPVATGNYNLWRLMMMKNTRIKAMDEKRSGSHWTSLRRFLAAVVNIAGCLMNLRMRLPPFVSFVWF